LYAVIRLLAVLVVLILGGLGVASTLAAAGQISFTVVTLVQEEQEIDLGEEGASVGDLYVFSGPLFDASEDDVSEESQVGRLDGECTTTSSPGPSSEARRLCVVNATFTEELGGVEIDTEIDAQGVGRLEAEDVVFAVTGGTGMFSTARGEATFLYEEDGDRITITYEVGEG
jgi:hypothetical protein